MSADLDAHLNMLQKRYLVAAGVLALCIVTAITLHKYDGGCLATVKGLQTAKQNLRLLRDANQNIKATLKQLNLLFPPDKSRLSAEQLLYARIDDIKLRFHGADITIGNIEDLGGQLAITFAIKGELQNYPLFLDALGDLERTVLPTVQIKALHIAQEELQQRQTLTYQVDGQLRFPLPASAAAPPQ